MFVCQVINPSLQTLEKWLLLYYHLQRFVRGGYHPSFSKIQKDLQPNISCMGIRLSWKVLGIKLMLCYNVSKPMTELTESFLSASIAKIRALRTMSPWDRFKGPRAAVTQWHSPEIETKEVSVLGKGREGQSISFDLKEEKRLLWTAQCSDSAAGSGTPSLSHCWGWYC